MVRLRNGIAALAALGLIGAAPASAATRAAQSLPAASEKIGSSSPARASAPMTEAAELRGGSSGLILGLVALLLAILLAGSGGGGGGNDSPG